MPRHRCCWCANRRGAAPEGQRVGVDRKQAAPLATPQPRSWHANPGGQPAPPGLRRAPYGSRARGGGEDRTKIKGKRTGPFSPCRLVTEGDGHSKKFGYARQPARSGQGTNPPAWRASALAAVGLDVKNDQKDRWNQHEHQAGHEAEIVGFHCRSLELRDRITAGGPDPARFIARCGWAPPAKPAQSKPLRSRARVVVVRGKTRVEPALGP